jgi:GPH family glycoside/pentoside/hexuronide:cation symporter
MPPLGVRLSYGAGGAVYAVKEAAYTMFVLLFYTQVLGLNGSITGIVIAVSLIWDAITDPLVGTLSDRLRSRWGRRHPFMVASIIPLGLGFIGLFSPPEPLHDSQSWLAAWLLFWSLWVRTFSTTFSIPSLALSTELTSDYQGRSQILGMRLAFLFLFSVLTPASALLLIFTASGDSDGRFVTSNYPLYGVLSCGICWVMASISSFGTVRYAEPFAAARGMPGLRDSLRDLSLDLVRTLSNRTFRNLLAFDIAMMAAYGVVSALNMLVWTYYWQFDARQVSIILSVPSLLAVGLVLLSLRPLGTRLEKYELLQLSAVGLILNCIWLYPLKMGGLLPDSSEGIVFALNFLFMLIFMYCFLMRGIQTQSIIADITDEHEWDHGLRQEGGFFAASNFANKVATIAGPLYGGLALDIVGLRSGMLPGEVAKPVLDGLVIAYGLGVLPGMLIAFIFGLRVTLGRERVAELQRLIRRRSETVDGARATDL